MKETILSIKLKEYRAVNQLTQRELAEYLDVSDKSISKWELCQTYPNKTNILQISAKLGISIETLLLDEMVEGQPLKRASTPRPTMLVLAVSLLVCLFLGGVILYQHQQVVAQNVALKKQQTDKELSNQKTASYRVVVIMDLPDDDPALSAFKHYLESNFAVSDFTQLVAEPAESKKMMVQTFIIQAKNNDLMNEYYDQIKSHVPNYLNLQVHYL